MLLPRSEALCLCQKSPKQDFLGVVGFLSVNLDRSFVVCVS